MSTLSATVTVTPSLDNTERSYLPIAVTSVILLCIILVVLIITLLVLLLKKSKRRVVVIKPPEVANPHYNHCKPIGIKPIHLVFILSQLQY